MTRCKYLINVSHQIKKGKCPILNKYEPVMNKLECLLYCPIITTRSFFGFLFTDIKNKYVNKSLYLKK
jgi:hypothetical protein